MPRIFKDDVAQRVADDTVLCKNHLVASIHQLSHRQDRLTDVANSKLAKHIATLVVAKTKLSGAMVIELVVARRPQIDVLGCGLDLLTVGLDNRFIAFV